MTKHPYHNLSSTTLFNFTDTLDRLTGNIDHGFYCGDVYEKLPKFGSPSGYIVPMVCFCDIPLALIKEHLDWYGNYAIGIKREYARKYMVNPVWYIHKDNPVVSKMFHSKNKIDLSESPLLPYLKQFLGFQEDSTGEERIKKFYDEREWRYIPQEPKFKATLITNKPYSYGKELAQDSSSKRVTRMHLEVDRIEYIIVRNEEDKTNLYPFRKKFLPPEKLSMKD